MISLGQFQDILADGFFDGDAAIAGIVIFAATLAVIFVLMKKNTFAALLLAIPVAFVYSLLGVLSADMLVVMIVVCVLGLAVTSKKTLGDRGWPSEAPGTGPSSSGP